MSKSKIFLNISEIASFIGQNSYDIITPFQRLFKKYDRHFKSLESDTRDTIKKYNILLENVLVEKNRLESNKENVPKEEYDILRTQLENDNESIKNELQFKSELVQTQSEYIQDSLGVETINIIANSDILTDTKRELVIKRIEDSNVSKTQKIALKKQATSFINKTHGTLKEMSAIEIFEKSHNVKLDTSQTYRCFAFKETKNYIWHIGGKMDGVYTGEPEPYVVEVKNRTRSFFNSLRDYEKTQIQLYMILANVGKAKLVEHLNGKNRITDIYRDETYIKQIQERLCVFVDKMDSFINETDIDEKRMFFNGTESQKCIFIKKLYLNEVAELESKQFEDSIGECYLDDDEEDDLS